MAYYLAIDIGASSGRHIVGWMENGSLQTKEVYRFPNGVHSENGHLVWDLEALTDSVKKGIDQALIQYPDIESLSVDTWGVDYVLMNGNREILPCYAYRDSRTQQSVPAVHEKVPFEILYSRTGIQFQPFNTVYQLYADHLEQRLESATDFLMMPQYLLYRLCGVKAHEYTDATTGGLVNAVTREYDPDLIRSLGFPARLFPALSSPGKKLGEYRGISCVLCASHDTASAVEGMPLSGNDLFLSSGTWSLLGAALPSPVTDRKSLAANWTNEGGVGYIRYLKNIMGMWVVNELRRELCPNLPFDEITAMAGNSSYSETVDVNDPVFLAPESMKAAFDRMLTCPPSDSAGYFRCAYQSLALCYRQAVQEITENTGRNFERLVIVGGGAKNAFLNRLTAQKTGLEILALPIEATALGNLKIQMEARR